MTEHWLDPVGNAPLPPAAQPYAGWEHYRSPFRDRGDVLSSDHAYWLRQRSEFERACGIEDEDVRDKNSAYYLARMLDVVTADNPPYARPLPVEPAQPGREPWYWWLAVHALAGVLLPFYALGGAFTTYGEDDAGGRIAFGAGFAVALVLTIVLASGSA